MILLFARFHMANLERIFLMIACTILMFLASVVILPSRVIVLPFDSIYCQCNRMKFCKSKQEKREREKE